MSAVRNTLSGFAEAAHVSNFEFENQRRTFHSYGYAMDPSEGNSVVSEPVLVGDEVAKEENKGKTVFESAKKRPEDKRKRLRNDNPGDIEGYLGPWGKFIDEKTVMKP